MSANGRTRHCRAASRTQSRNSTIGPVLSAHASPLLAVSENLAILPLPPQDGLFIRRPPRRLVRDQSDSRNLRLLTQIESFHAGSDAMVQGAWRMATEQTPHPVSRSQWSVSLRGCRRRPGTLASHFQPEPDVRLDIYGLTSPPNECKPWIRY